MGGARKRKITAASADSKNRFAPRKRDARSHQYNVVIGRGAWSDAAEMNEPDPELAKKAHRAQLILYGVMIFFGILPFILLWMKNRGVFN